MARRGSKQERAAQPQVGNPALLIGALIAVEKNGCPTFYLRCQYKGTRECDYRQGYTAWDEKPHLSAEVELCRHYRTTYKVFIPKDPRRMLRWVKEEWKLPLPELQCLHKFRVTLAIRKLRANQAIHLSGARELLLHLFGYEEKHAGEGVDLAQVRAALVAPPDEQTLQLSSLGFVIMLRAEVYDFLSTPPSFGQLSNVQEIAHVLEQADVLLKELTPQAQYYDQVHVPDPEILWTRFQALICCYFNVIGPLMSVDRDDAERVKWIIFLRTFYDTNKARFDSDGATGRRQMENETRERVVKLSEKEVDYLIEVQVDPLEKEILRMWRTSEQVAVNEEGEGEEEGPIHLGGNGDEQDKYEAKRLRRSGRKK